MDKIINNIKKKSARHNSQKSALLGRQNGGTNTVPKITMTLDEEEDVDAEFDSNGVHVNPTHYVNTNVDGGGAVASAEYSNANNTNHNTYSKNCAHSKTIGFPDQNDNTVTATGMNRMTIAVGSDHYRKQSTGTLNRLILVAQALEFEVDSRQRSDVNGSRIVCIIRMANVLLLLLVNVLIVTGVGQYHGRNDARLSLLLTMDKWYFRHGIELPATFAEMRLSGQYLAQALSAAMFLVTVALQILHCCRVQHSKLMCICYSFGCVPFALLVFGLEMHYSACPWLDDFYRAEVLRRDFHAVEKYFDTQCGINGWALAGIFSLLSCGLFVSEGLITVFFRSGVSHNESQKTETIL